VLTVRDPQMVRDQKFGNHWPKMYDRGFRG